MGGGFDPKTLLILIPVAVLGFVGLLLWKLFRGAKRRAEQRAQEMADLEARRAMALPSTARVVQSEPLPSELRDQHGFGLYREVKLTLEVQPPAGGPARDAYAASATWDVQVTAMPRVAPGATVPVLVDPKMDERRVYPAEPWARSAVG